MMEKDNEQLFKDRLMLLISQEYSHLSQEEQLELLKSIIYISKQLEGRIHTPEQLMSLINGYVVWARIDIKDIIGSKASWAVEYFRNVFKW